MNRFLRTLPVLWLFVTLLSGCTTRIHGEKISDSTVPIEKILVLADDVSKFEGQSKYSTSSNSLNTTTRKIFQALEVRLPIVFKLNGIDADVRLSSKPFATASTPPSHVITLIPKSGNTSPSVAMTTVHMEGKFYEARSKKVVWKATISYGGVAAETTGNGSADSFAQSLLIQLKKDGVLSYPTSDPIMPKE